ncbi:hypothetical protein LN030_28865, partial [Klebsiella pneumoniae]|nr:hypothetical protein [Klebsiella pneumoniae]
TLNKLRELSTELKADAAALRRDGVYRCCAVTYEYAAAHIDAILRESEAQGDAGAVEAWERRLRGRAGPFTARAGERYVEADVALEAFRFALAARATLDEEAELTEQVQARVAELEADARRWRKCKRMRKSWWLAALTEAGMMYGRSLDEQIDEQPDAPADFME